MAESQTSDRERRRLEQQSLRMSEMLQEGAVERGTKGSRASRAVTQDLLAAEDLEAQRLRRQEQYLHALQQQQEEGGEEEESHSATVRRRISRVVTKGNVAVVDDEEEEIVPEQSQEGPSERRVPAVMKRVSARARVSHRHEDKSKFVEIEEEERQEEERQGE